ncbi:MAG: GGDEF domain-containing protein [Termitinemataceae bacterium]
MQDRDEFLENPQVVLHYNLLQDLGVFSHIDQLKREIKNNEMLLHAALEILHCTTIDSILETAVKEISDRFLPSFLVFLWKTSNTRSDVLVRGYQNFKSIDVQLDIASLSPFEEFFTRYPKPINFDLFEFQLNNPQAASLLANPKPEVVIPITGPSGLYGLILVGPKLLEAQYSLQELSYLDKIMAFTSQAIQNHLHYEFSVRDGKTGLYNHGYFTVRVRDEIARSIRIGQPFSILIIDVDRFKHFNDTYGHLAGDAVLEQLAQIIQKKLRVQDIPSRFGGEEFTVLLPETNRAAAWIVAERIRTAIAEAKIPWEPPLPQVTISLGVAVFDQKELISPEELIQRADAALYQSKQRGRNRTTVWGAGLLSKTQQLRSQVIVKEKK